jgi:hypothetical protein
LVKIVSGKAGHKPPFPPPKAKQMERTMGIFLRFLGAFALLAATYNPTQWNYVRWVNLNWPDQMPLALFLGLVLLVGYLVYVMSTLRSIGPLGVLLTAAILGAGLWVLIDWGILSLTNATLNTWLGLFALAVIIGLGLSWSIIRQKLSGQATVDEVQD